LFEDLLPEIEKSISNFTGAIPVVFKGIEHHYAKGNHPNEPNRHVFHELLHMKTGKVNFDIEGRKLILRQGDTLIIRPEKSHRISVREGQTDVIVLYFNFKQATPAVESKFIPDSSAWDAGYMNISKPTLENFLQFAGGEKASRQQPRDNPPFLTIKGKTRSDISVIVDRILKEGSENAYGKKMMMQFLTMELLVALSRGLREEWEDNLSVKEGKIRELIQLAKEFIINNYDQNITINQAAAFIFLSQGYFARTFREQTGMSPMSFLMHARIEAACQLLEQEDIKVGSIALNVGFASPQRFNAAFKKYMGITPMEHRRNRLGLT
jgi:AraC-like DNA-binding protein